MSTDDIKVPLPRSLQEIVGALLFASQTPLTITDLRQCIRGVEPAEGDNVEVVGVYQSCTTREVEQAVETGESTTFFCRIRNIQIDETFEFADSFDIDLTKLDPVVYSGMYHSIGKVLGRIGDFANLSEE